MISKYIALLFAAVGLAGCCVSGNGCYAPLPGVPIAWDGLGPAPSETGLAIESQPGKNARPKREIIIGPIGDLPTKPNPKPQAKAGWDEQEAADRADEAKLAKQLMICRNCLPASARDDASSGVAH